jgi:hypothetical protein
MRSPRRQKDHPRETSLFFDQILFMVRSLPRNAECLHHHRAAARTKDVITPERADNRCVRESEAPRRIEA